MQFESENQSMELFLFFDYVFENVVNMYPLFFTDTQWCAVTKLMPMYLSNRTFLINKVKGMTTSLSNSTIRL